MKTTDTIVALSSPPVGAGSRVLQRAIIRLSGPRAIELADAVFKPDIPEQLKPVSSILHSKPRAQPAMHKSLAEAATQKGWRRVAGNVTWKTHTLKSCAYIMRAPHSYTREDIVELHVPALPWAVDELIDTLISLGARSAEPGEFTRRAFEHGRLSIEQAESVGNLIASAGAAEARAHAQQLHSHLDLDRQKLKAGLEELLSQVELGLDFAHEDVVVIAAGEMERRVNELLDAARALADESARESTRTTATVPRIVLAGPTNAGKSMLFNALAGRDAAIVSAQRHTTRDSVEAPMTLRHGNESFAVTLVDCAGAGTHTDTAGGTASLLNAAWDASLRALRGADVVLLALDGSVPLAAQEGLPPLIAEVDARDADRILLWTKSDLPVADGNGGGVLGAPAFQHTLSISALNGDGIEALREILGAHASELSRRSAEAHAAAGAARRACARTIAEALERAAQALRESHGEDAVAVELREAIHACWQAEGILMRHDAVTEAALDKIFARFCIGK